MSRSIAAVLLLPFVVIWSSAGHQADAQGQALPDGLTLDFLAHDRDGRPVDDLTPGELRLRVGGKARPLLSLERIGTETDRDIVLLVDEGTLFGLEPVARDAIAAVLDALPPGDRLSYLNTSSPGQLTRMPGHEAVLAGLESMRTGPGELWACIPDLLRAIENIAKTMPPGRGSTLAVLTRGVLDEDADLPPNSIGCAAGREDLRATQQVVASTQINLHFFAVTSANRSWGLDTVAGNTGGMAGFVTWKDTGALWGALERTRAFYRASLAADPAVRQPQRVELSTSRRGVRITTTSSLVR